MKRFWQDHWPLPAATALFALLVAYLLVRGLHATGGQFTYPLDDAYIHLAHARNLALHGVWGVTSHEFSSSSSSLLWTLLLAAACPVAGDRVLTPLILNILLGAGVLALAWRWLRARIASRPLQALLLAAIVLLTPLAPLALMGMEHTLHVLLALAFLAAFDAALSRSGAPARQGLALAVLAALMVMTRYEGLFMVAVAGALLLGLGRWKTGLALWAAGWLPVLGYGIFSLRHGGWFLPNTLLLKGTVPALGPRGVLLIVNEFCNKFQKDGAMTALLLGTLALLAFGASRPAGRRGGVLLPLYAGTLVLHASFAQFGFLFRYEAYLVALGVLVLADAALRAGGAELRWWPLRERWSFKLALAALALGVLVPFKVRGFDTLRYGPVAAKNIHEQQVQMARFVKACFPDAAIAVNDIGAVAYYADPRLLDLWGLATQEVARAKRRGEFDTQVIAALARARGVRLAMVYDAWFSGEKHLPEAWVKVGQWVISDNYTCGSDTVSFYAVEPALARRLSDALRTFGARLPGGVRQSITYSGSK